MPAKVKPLHYRAGYHVAARRVRQAADANPDTRCWRCGRTLEEVRRLVNPNAKWTAGHLIDGQPGGTLAPECSPCNHSHGAKAGNQRRNRKPWTSREW